MEKVKVGFFESSEGRRSSTRLQMFITMFFAFIVTGYQVYDGSVDILLILLLFTAAFIPKQIQNFSEKKEMVDIVRSVSSAPKSK